jgi:hypothetical protein
MVTQYQNTKILIENKIQLIREDLERLLLNQEPASKETPAFIETAKAKKSVHQETSGLSDVVREQIEAIQKQLANLLKQLAELDQKYQHAVQQYRTNFNQTYAQNMQQIQTQAAAQGMTITPAAAEEMREIFSFEPSSQPEDESEIAPEVIQFKPKIEKAAQSFAKQRQEAQTAEANEPSEEQQVHQTLRAFTILVRHGNTVQVHQIFMEDTSQNSSGNLLLNAFFNMNVGIYAVARRANQELEKFRQEQQSLNEQCDHLRAQVGQQLQQPKSGHGPRG